MATPPQVAGVEIDPQVARIAVKFAVDVRPGTEMAQEAVERLRIFGAEQFRRADVENGGTRLDAPLGSISSRPGL
jgi:hypothetical protein